jgi:multimeric flavodoxin WrbA
LQRLRRVPCQEDRQCAIKKDVFHEVFAKMLKADAIILGSPVTSEGSHRTWKALVERSGYVARANGNAFAGKIGAAVTPAPGGAIHAFDTINHIS